MAIKFNLHHVTNGKIKARVWYSLDNHVSGKPTVTIYAKDYSGDLGKLIGDAYKNETDMMSDYFDKGSVRLQEGHALYAAARAAAEAAKDAQSERAAKRDARRANPQPADPSTVKVESYTPATETSSAAVVVTVSGLPISIVVGRFGCTVHVQNAMARAYRGIGRVFASIADARKNYRDGKVLAALDAAEKLMSKPLVHVKADCVEVAEA